MLPLPLLCALPTTCRRRSRDAVLVPWALEVLGWPDHHAPPVRHRTMVKPAALRRLFEVVADDVNEVVETDLRIRVKGVDVVDDDQSADHVPRRHRARPALLDRRAQIVYSICYV